MVSDADRILRDLQRALKSEDLRKEVERIIKKYRKTASRAKKPHYELKAGHSYFINESAGHIARVIFEQVTAKGYRGLCITRTRPEDYELYERVPDAKYIWLSSIKTGNSVEPKNLTKILSIIKDFLNSLEDGARGVIMIDGAEAIITNRDFNSFLKFIQATKDSVSEKRGLLIMPIDLKTLEENECAKLSHELIEISVKKR